MNPKMLSVIFFALFVLSTSAESALKAEKCLFMCQSFDDEEICVTDSMKCDNVADCADASDEECGCRGFGCRTGECINVHDRCNGRHDCPFNDYSDEENCTMHEYSRFQGTEKCPKYCEFGKCEFREMVPVCVCGKGFEGEFCQKSIEKEYFLNEIQNSKEFICGENAKEGIIRHILHCNGKKDCPRGEDELGCSKRDYFNKKCMMPCDKGLCIFDASNHAVCECSNGFSGPFCEVQVPKTRETPSVTDLPTTRSMEVSEGLTSSGFMRALCLPYLYLFALALLCWCLM